MKEILRRHPSDVSEFSEQLIARVLEAYADTDCNVNVAAEEMFGQLAVSLPTKTIIDQLIPATPQPSDSTSSSLLGVIKFLSKVRRRTRREQFCGWCSSVSPSPLTGCGRGQQYGHPGQHGGLDANHTQGESGLGEECLCVCEPPSFVVPCSVGLLA